MLLEGLAGVDDAVRVAQVLVAVCAAPIEMNGRGFGPGGAIGRVHDPVTEIVTLSDYRRRHGQYREDADLQALHAAVPFICTWDDHELTNDAHRTGAENHQPATEGRFETRQAAAYRAYFEWMPIRRPQPFEAPTRLYRSFRFGSLADLQMLDLRQYRDAQPVNGQDPARHDPERTLMGTAQLDWLKERLGDSSAHWMGVPFNVDAWDGYTGDRRDLLEFLGAEAVGNVAFLTGDIHSSWACEVPRDSASYLNGLPSVAVELVGTSITSANLNEILGVPPRSPQTLQVEGLFKAANRHVKLLEFDSHGYSVIDVTPDRLQADWYYVSDPAVGRRRIRGPGHQAFRPMNT